MDAQPPPPQFVERFRVWYEYERDCNAKVITMLESVPASNRSSPQFVRAVGKAAHLVAARHMWLFRLGVCGDTPSGWFPTTTIEQLPAATAELERRWVTYLGALTERDVLGPVEWVGADDKRRRWLLLDLLTQIFGHAWYHRGQVALLVKDLGGTPIDADYIFWDRPTIVGT